MIIKNIFNNENNLLMFYHTTFRNVISLTALAFVALTFSNKYKNIKYLMFAELISLILICAAIYLNYTLLKIIYNNKSDKSYKYINKYFIINLFMAIIHIIIIAIIIIKIKNSIF